MLRKKKYMSTGANPLSIDITDDNGVLRSFDFRGGMKHPIVIPPFYSTSNELEQKLLESYPGFNKSYVLEEGEEVIQEVEPVKAVVAEVLGKVEELESNEQSFDNVQQAKDWLNKEKGVPFSALKNKQMVITEAEKLNIVLKFNEKQ